jgi:plasmid maintenance system killer protein
VIKSFKDRRAKAIFERRDPGKGFPPDLIHRARRKLVMLADAGRLEDLGRPPGNNLEALKVVGPDSIRSGSTSSGASASSGSGMTPKRSRS